MPQSMPPFQAARVLVVGDVMLDRYYHGSATRISPEAPVPVVRVNNQEDRPGGAGNVALNIAALGGAATLIGVVGADATGERNLIHAPQAGGHRAQLLPQPVQKYRYGQLRAGMALGSGLAQLAPVAAQLGEPDKAAALVQPLIQLLQADPLPLQVQQQPWVHAAAAAGHYQTLQRGEPHGGVNAAAIPDRR